MESNSNLEAIGKRIAEQRQKKHLTQAELGKLVCVSREIINYWENGSRDIKTGNIVLLAEALDTTCDYLLRGIELKNVDISKETGLSNKAIENLRDVARFSSSSNPLFASLDDFLTSENLVGFLMYYYFFQQEGWAYKQAVADLTQALSHNNMNEPKDILKYAYSITNIDDPLYLEAERLTNTSESLQFALFRVNNALKDILDEYMEGL